MKQLLYSPKEGRGTVVEVPVPAAQRGRVLVRTAASLVSAGTERAAVEQSRKSLVERARERPELVKKVFERVKAEGLAGTVQSVRAKLGEPYALGYSAAGVVIETGAEVEGFRAGDRVACAGVGYASHAEVLSVPKNLCVRVPDAVDFESAAFATLGAIALQGVRLAEPTLGESVVVVGLGLLGQLTAQILRANGCRVFGLDLDQSKIDLARQLGMDDGAISDEDAGRACIEWTRGRGADAVIITAAAESDQPIRLAGEVSRLKGRVVAVGLVGMNVPRDVYFRRELTLRVSMSYGPGRYDPDYEERGHDYPLPYVRWTEGRNLEAFLDLLAAGRVRVAPLVTHRFEIEEGGRAYDLIAGDAREPHLGVVINYDAGREVSRVVENEKVVGRAAGSAAGAASQTAGGAARDSSARASSVRVGLVGAGGYAGAVLLPHLKSLGADFRTVATATGLSARRVGERFGFARFASDADEVINDAEVNLVVIATRHDTHAEYARRALARGLHVFVEKPLALTDEELDAVIEVAGASPGRLAVGFNRRFSPLAQKCAGVYADRRAPLSIVYRVNAGRLPAGHWVKDSREGGGRVVSEVCHFVDLMQFFAGAPPVRVYAEPLRARSEEIGEEDSLFVTVAFADGSAGSIAYLSEGDAGLAKERVEVFGGGQTFVIEDFRAATLYRDGREERTRQPRQDKGQLGLLRAVCATVIDGAPAPIPLEELVATTRATFRIRDSLRAGRPLEVV
jgi:predicted dehydrogenase/threonine dehydrogenase-like Zn-dependent dehydrogenase